MDNTSVAVSNNAGKSGLGRVKGLVPGFIRDVLRPAPKTQWQMSTTTGFFRNEPQLSVVTSIRPKPLKIFVFGCSDGCEAYSIAMAYKDLNPATPLKISGWDIEEPCIQRARAAVYKQEQLDYYRTNAPEIRAKQRYFESSGAGAFKVKSEITGMCSFEIGSILDAGFMAGVGTADIVFCQNVLVHLPGEAKAQAVENLCKTVRPDGLLAIGGMRPASREAIALKQGLKPITDKCEEIHNSWIDLRALWDNNWFWQRPYYALEPFRKCSHWEHRYGSLFFLPSRTAAASK